MLKSLEEAFKSRHDLVTPNCIYLCKTGVQFYEAKKCFKKCKSQNLITGDDSAKNSRLALILFICYQDSFKTKCSKSNSEMTKIIFDPWIWTNITQMSNAIFQMATFSWNWAWINRKCLKYKIEQNISNLVKLFPFSNP